jgi:hypothetical protein
MIAIFCEIETYKKENFHLNGVLPSHTEPINLKIMNSNTKSIYHFICETSNDEVFGNTINIDKKFKVFLSFYLPFD